MSEGKAHEAPQGTTWALLPGAPCSELAAWVSAEAMMASKAEEEPTSLGTRPTVLSLSVVPECPWAMPELRALEHRT